MTTQRSRRDRTGFTLLEVVIGVMLMASLVVGSLTALSRYRSSLAMAARKRQAMVVADDLLNVWVQSSNGLPGASVGEVGGESLFRWQTRVLSQRLICGVQTEVVRLEIYHPQSSNVAPYPLATVDYVRGAASLQRGF
ncbi:type II secretion system protein [Stieleria marina]|uniref:type II secretion system protein n=1 Tax=Stieleria marina TaxID=1930275 RepID=UPI003AF33286